MALMNGEVVKEIDIEGLRRVYEVSLPAEFVEPLLNEELRKKASESSFAGFRKGKVTIDLVKKMCDVESIVAQIVVDKSLSAVIASLPEDSKEISSSPKIISLEIKDYMQNKGSALCSLEIELMPNVPLISPQDIQLEKYVVDLSEDDIEKRIAELISKSFKHTKEESDSYSLKEGDIAYIDFMGKIDGKAFKAGTAKDFKVVIGANALVPEIESALIGMMLNEEKQVPVSFDLGYHDKEVAGKDADFLIKVNSIERKEALQSREDLMAHLKCQNEDDFKLKIRESIEFSVKRFVRDMMVNDFSKKVDQAYSFDLPKSMVEKERSTIRQYYEQNPDQNPDQNLEGKLSSADSRVKFGMIFARFANANGIEVTKDELASKVLAMVNGNKDYAVYMLNLLNKNSQMLNGFMADILENKVIDVLLSQVSVEEKKVTFDELLKIAGGVV